MEEVWWLQVDRWCGDAKEAAAKEVAGMSVRCEGDGWCGYAPLALRVHLISHLGLRGRCAGGVEADWHGRGNTRLHLLTRCGCSTWPPASVYPHVRPVHAQASGPCSLESEQRFHLGNGQFACRRPEIAASIVEIRANEVGLSGGSPSATPSAERCAAQVAHVETFGLQRCHGASSLASRSAAPLITTPQQIC